MNQPGLSKLRLRKRSDWPRLRRCPPKERMPDAWWDCQVCDHVFDKELNDLTEISSNIKGWCEYYIRRGETNKRIAEILDIKPEDVLTIKHQMIDEQRQKMHTE